MNPGFLSLQRRLSIINQAKTFPFHSCLLLLSRLTIHPQHPCHRRRPKTGNMCLFSWMICSLIGTASRLFSLNQHHRLHLLHPPPHNFPVFSFLCMYAVIFFFLGSSLPLFFYNLQITSFFFCKFSFFLTINGLSLSLFIACFNRLHWLKNLVKQQRRWEWGWGMGF